MKYEKNFLTKVILRVDFAPAQGLMTDKKTAFSDDIRGDFPNVTASQAAQFQFSFGPAGTGLSQQPRGWIWTHANEGGSRTVTLAVDSLVIEYGKDQYEDFKEFRKTIEAVFAPLKERVGVQEFTRIGLRYIDEIDLQNGDPLNWDGIIHGNLATSLKAGMIDGIQLTRSMHQLTAIKDDASIIFNYGMHNPDFPSPVARRLFVLDYDVSITGVVEFNAAVGKITDLNKICESMFEASIEDGLRDLMGVVDEQ